MIIRRKELPQGLVICIGLFCFAIHGFGQTDNPPITIKVNLNNHSEDIGPFFKEYTFIPLETSKDCLVGRVTVIQKHGEHFFLFNSRNNMLLSYTVEGKFQSNYVKIGQGPGEVASISSFMVDYKNDDVVIYSWDKKSNLYFGVDGSFKKEVPNSIGNEGMIMLENGHIAYYTGKPYNFIDDKLDYSYLIITDSQSEISYSGINVPLIKRSGFVLYQSFPKYKDEVYFKHPYPDTIYSITTQGVRAKYVMDFGEHQIDWNKIKPKQPIKIHSQIRGQKKATILHYFFEFENWIFFDVRHGKEYYYALYNKASKETEIFDPKTTINSTGGTLGKVVGATETGLICIVETLDLLYPDSPSSRPSNLKSNKDLASLVSKLNDTDNPVLIICDLK